MFFFQPQIEPNTVVILTETLNGQGDYHAALKLILKLKKEHRELSIIWFRGTESISLESEKEALIDKVYDLNVISVNPQSQKLYSRFILASSIIEFPVKNALSKPLKSEVNNLRKKCGLPAIQSINEYDFVESSHLESDEIQSGLAEQSLGIFMDLPEQESKSFDMLLKTHIGQVLFEKSSITSYKSTHALYFGYCNTLTDFSLNKVNGTYFIHLVASITSHKRDFRDLDIIIPLSDRDINEIMKSEFTDHLKCLGIKQIEIDGSNPRHLQTGLSEGKTLRIISSHFPLSNEIFRSLMLLSEHDAILCTGDQSFSDVFSIQGALPIYQIMPWKDSFVKNIFDLFNSTRDEKQPLSALASLLYQTRSDFSPELQGQFIAEHQQELIEQAVKAHQYVLAHKNLYTNLFNLIQSQVRDAQRLIQSERQTLTSSSSIKHV